jgi:hypothetical protein
VNPKVAVALVIVIAVLFFGALGFGLSRDDGQDEAPAPSWAEGIGDMFQLRASLAAEDIGATVPSSCRTQVRQGLVTLPPGGGCTFLIVASSGMFPKARGFSLLLEQGIAVSILLKQKDQITVKEMLTAEESQHDFFVAKDGGSVEMRCLPPLGTPCRVRMGE